jgi:methyl-accepting chemotaxis protein
MKHTPTPWKVDTGSARDEYMYVLGASNETIAELYVIDRGIQMKANAERIVACVNVMAGIEDPEQWVLNAKRLMEAQRIIDVSEKIASNSEQLQAELEQANKKLEEMESLAHAIADHLPSIPDQIKMRVRINTILGINAGGAK